MLRGSRPDELSLGDGCSLGLGEDVGAGFAVLVCVHR
jgi:hypothetical protein